MKAPGKPLDLFYTLNHFDVIILGSALLYKAFVHKTSMTQRNDTDEALIPGIQVLHQYHVAEEAVTKREIFLFLHMQTP